NTRAVETHRLAVVGQQGDILHTEDGGKTWKFQTSGTGENLNRVHFGNEYVGLAAGDNGTLLITLDGGKRWTKQDSGTDKDLRGISFVGDTLFAVGEKGVAIKYEVESLAKPELIAALTQPKTAVEPEVPVVVEEPKIETGLWEVVRQLEGAADYTDVFFVDENQGWAVGVDGVIVHTEDGGKIWIRQDSGTKSPLRSVWFLNANEGWVSGPNGTLLYTTDGGATWQPKELKAKENLGRIYFVDDKHGWITKGQGSFLHTDDGGENWKTQKSNLTYSAISDVCFVNPDRGWAITRSVGGGGTLLIHSENGGELWYRGSIEEETPKDEFENGRRRPRRRRNPSVIGIRFFDEQRGILVSPDGALYKTVDGGVKWTITPPLLKGAGGISEPVSDKRIYAFHFIDFQTGWLVGEAGAIYHTRDEGETWQEQDSKTNSNFSKVYFLDDKRGWAVGELGVIIHTEDGGDNWTVQAAAPEAYSLKKAYFINLMEGWAIGEKGIVLQTKDGGKTWKQQEIGDKKTLVGMTIVGELGWGWLMSSDGSVFYTSDNGEKWIKQELINRKGIASQLEVYSPLLSSPPSRSTRRQRRYNLQDAQFVKMSEGWAVGEDGVILHNIDGGKLWTQQESPTNARLKAVHFPVYGTGWTVGQEGVVLYTASRGVSWKLLNSTTAVDLEGVHFINTQEGWAVGHGGLIIHTIDCGATWKAQKSNTNKTLYDILFVSGEEGYAVGAEGLIIHTTDGGATWVQQESGTTNDLYDISIGENGGLWIVGKWGVVLKHKDMSIGFRMSSEEYYSPFVMEHEK
ncbi:MAG: WD40/YVTN/BNR-like repeat-containing protein, partial [Candidatus Poribacteria bacterium]